MEHSVNGLTPAKKALIRRCKMGDELVVDVAKELGISEDTASNWIRAAAKVIGAALTEMKHHLDVLDDG